MKQKALIFGTTDFAQVAAVYLSEDSPFDVVGFTVSRAMMTEPSILGLNVFPFEDLRKSHPPSEFVIFCCVGYSKVNANRASVFQQCEAAGYDLPTYVHSSVKRRPETLIGRGCFIFEDNVIQPFVKIGDNCVLWSGNHIGHHSTIGDNVFIASHVVISGRCTIGNNVFIGVNAALRDGITVGHNAVVGAGTLLLGDTDDNAVFRGPATLPADRTSQQLNKI